MHYFLGVFQGFSYYPSLISGGFRGFPGVFGGFQGFRGFQGFSDFGVFFRKNWKSVENGQPKIRNRSKSVTVFPLEDVEKWKKNE